MRIFNRHLEGLSILSCCTLLEDHPSPSKTDSSVLTIPQQQRIPVDDSKIENHQPRPVPALLPEARRKSICRDKEWLTRTKSVISFVSANRSISGLRALDCDGFSRSSHLPAPSSPSSLFPSPTSTVFNQIGDEKSRVTNKIFQPLSLRFSKSENEWETVISQVCSQISSEILNDEKQPISVTQYSDTTKLLSPSSEDSITASNQSDVISNQNSEQRISSHMRVHSEPATFERIKMALDERYKLTQRLKDLEDDIERKSIYLGSRPNSPVSSKGSALYKVPDLPHPLKSAPTHPFRRPATRSFSLNSNVRPDWGTPMPPLPLMLQPSITRKEKNISRVSSWLISNQNENQVIPNSVTHNPRPVTDREGFYQCLGSSQLTTETVTSISDCYSDQPTTWTSNYSIPAIKSDVFTYELPQDCEESCENPEDTVNSSNPTNKVSTNRPELEKIDTGVAF